VTKHADKQSWEGHLALGNELAVLGGHLGLDDEVDVLVACGVVLRQDDVEVLRAHGRGIVSEARRGARDGLGLRVPSSHMAMTPDDLPCPRG
jgi:hypothetical protein